MIESDLRFALDWRTRFGFFQNTEALRIFYGPGESKHPELSEVAVDLFKDHLWITQWKAVSQKTLDAIVKFYSKHYQKQIVGMVLMDRSQVASEADSKPIYGEVRNTRYSVNEKGIEYVVQMGDTKHPGLFLDHAPLRSWLKTSQTGKSVLNLFSYTGSLSVAAGIGGAEKVVTLDLSRPTIEWAKENWANAKLDPTKGDFIFGDTFEWLPKFAKRNEAFDTILCDPPSFSRSKKGTFSTQKDSARLHEQIFTVLKTGGILVTSINSENYPERNFLADIELAADKSKCSIQILKRIDLPETFPTQGDLKTRYLKGFYILKK